MIDATPRLDLPMEQIAAICRKYHVRELSLFGSVLRDDFGPESDVDFLVVFEPEARIGFVKLFGLQHEFEELLQRSVDVVPKDGLNPVIRKAVLDSARVIYEVSGST